MEFVKVVADLGPFFAGIGELADHAISLHAVVTPEKFAAIHVVVMQADDCAALQLAEVVEGEGAVGLPNEQLADLHEPGAKRADPTESPSEDPQHCREGN